MHTKNFELTTDFIELIKLLKLIRLASSGGDAKMLVDSGEVKLNGAIELRKRAKLRKGDLIEVGAIIIKIN
jgi:ribosome-associated protein